MDSEVVDWVSAHFLPFEAELRTMLRRVCAGPSDIDDAIQETYAKVLSLDSVAHVREPRAFLVRTAKNIVTDRLRRDAVVRIEAMANLEELAMDETAPSAERVALARVELNWVVGLIARLPERCKDVFQARRLYGLSQHETAQTLGLTVGIVEQESLKGMDLISDMIARGEKQPALRSARQARTRKGERTGRTEC
jgi:RNA polymerase sigma-70 factor (ECF subfamily)